ncbi:zinc finger protein 653 [Pseudophryne corroboree]|uniref:zinc finger protein 653 n=1 Tax=Pseudophryne corroboree TaxID=495146 RepID=UPI003081CF97
MAAPVTEAPGSEEEEEEDAGRKVRGRPRLTDTDRVRRRLESRKKYDCRRVYLGEAHGAWVLRRERGGEGEAWSDAKLAAYLLALERHGKPCGELQTSAQQHRTRRRRCVNNLLSLVTWYYDHKGHCPHEPGLSELDISHVRYATAVWQCQAGHRYFQDLSCPLKTLNRQASDDGGSSDDSSSRSAPLIHPPEMYPEPQEPIHPLYSQHSESLTEGDTQYTDETETVVCVPMGTGTGGLFDGVTQEALGQVVAASCPSQVIIIAGPGYEALAAEGIHLDVAGGSNGEEGTCTTLEAVSAFTQTEFQEEERDEVTITEEDTLYTLQAEQCEEEEPQQVMLGTQLPEEGPAGPGTVEDGDCRTESTQHVLKEPEKKRNRRSRVADADGVLEMFHCPYEGCAQVYTALNSFQNHVNLVHRKGKTKVCPEAGCGKKFYLSNHLRRHMIIHTGVREFICETCGKSFKRKSHLEVHRRTHTGETPLQCEVCGFQCRQRASLNWHMKKHGSEIQYSFSCEQCGKLFEKRESVKFHKLKSHPEGRAT